MRYLVDTNILLRFVVRSHPLHPSVRAAIRKLKQENNILYVTSQNCIEFWNVATRPIDRNGFGFTPAETEKFLRLIERIFTVLADSSTVYITWRSLVVKFNVSGVQVHDARLVAAMQANNITHILTFNTRDFVRYTNDGIMAVEPANV